MSRFVPLLSDSMILAGLAVLLACRTAPSLAQTVAPLTAVQSASLDRAIRLWTNSPLVAGPGAPADYSVTPEGDHYHLDKPLAMSGIQAGAAIQGGRLTATVRPLDGGRWQFTDVKVGTPLTITAPTGKDTGVVSMTLDVKEQDGLAVVDSTLSTPSTFDGSASGISATMEVPTSANSDKSAPSQARVSFRSGAVKTHGVWQPSAVGRVDRSSTATVDDLGVEVAGKQKVSIAIRRLRSEITAKGLSMDRLAAVTALVRRKVPGLTMAKPPPAPGGATPDGKVPAAGVEDQKKLTLEQRRALHATLQALRDIASSFDLSTTLDDAAFSYGGHVVRFHQIAVSEGVAAPGGRADAHMRIRLEGLASPDIPPAIAENYLPHRLVVAPHVTGMAVDALFDMAGAMIDDAAPRPQTAGAHAAALLARGPVSVGLDELAFDIGQTTLSAAGSVQITSTNPQDMIGSATIEAKHLSALIKHANADPMLQQVAPLLIFLKGIGDENDNGTVVWKVTYAGGRVSVNGTDLSQMLPHK